MVDVYGFDRKRLGCSEEFCYWKYPNKILEDMGMENADYTLDIIGLATWLVLLQIMLVIVLIVRVRMSSS